MSDNEVVVRSGKTIPISDMRVEVRDADARTVFVDFITESRVSNGVAYLSMGSIHTDADNAPVVEVTTRLRLDIVTAQVLHATLGDLIAQAHKRPDNSAAN